MDKESEHPLVRIAESLERVAILLEKMANPPLMVRIPDGKTKEFYADI